jgi:hypothetical protein
MPKKELPIKDSVTEMADVAVTASVSFDVWWELQNAGNRHKYEDTMERYNQFFRATIDAHMLVLFITLYQMLEKRKDTQNINSVLERMRSEFPEHEYRYVEVERRIEELRPTWRKIAQVRSEIYAHRSKRANPDEVFEKVGITANEIGNFVKKVKVIVKILAGSAGILGIGVVDMKCLMQELDLNAP